jgi:hypothetical protein
MKKTLVFAILGFMIAGTALESCKKGDGDPFMSLHSRKGRLSGDWKLVSGTGTDVNGSNTTTYTYDGTNVVASPGGSSGYTLEWKIEKDGSYTSTEVQTYGGITQTSTTTGVWNFTGKIGDDKNKDHVVFYPRSETVVTASGSSTVTTTDTYTGDVNSSTMQLTTLKNKELVVKSTYTHTDSNGTTSTTSEFTFNQ